jgi:hypothetical protein
LSGRETLLKQGDRMCGQLQSLAEDLRVLGHVEDVARTDAKLADLEGMRSLEQIPKN